MSLGHRQPLMLSFGALDRARPDTLDLLEVLAVQMAERPTRLLVVLTLAQDDALGMPGVEGALERLTTHSSFSRVVFEPLDDADAKSLARHSLEQGLGQVGVEKVAEFIAARAYGNPLYIKRLARFLVQSDLLEQVGTQVELSASVAPSHLLPPIISEFISQRLESLVGAFESRQHIQMMLLRWAMLGQSCSESLLRQVLRQEAREGHSCAAHILVRLDNLVERLLQLKVIEVESELERDGQVRRRFLFRNPLVMQFLLKRADYMPTAPGVHRLMGEVKRRYYGAAGQLESHREDVDRHERRSRLPAPNRAPAGWESHSEHWRWEGS